MTRVIVVGGGVAGSAAALAAVRSGVSVTVVDGSDRLPPDRSLFPYLLSGRCSEEDLYRPGERDLSKESGINLRLGERIRRVDVASRVVRSGDAELPFDSLVIASGSEYSSELPKGLSKRGAFVLKGADDYLSLSEDARRASHVILAGQAPLALVAASELSSKVKVSAFLGNAGMRRYSPGVRRRIVSAAEERKVALIEATIDAVAGVKHVEAVLSGGSVLACDVAAILPGSRPGPPESECLKGTHGGIVVDESMRASPRGVFAAGDCAELRLGAGSFPFRLRSSALVMGEAAGKNARGASVRAGVSGTMALHLFGTEVCIAGLAEADAKSLGIDAMRVDSDELEDDPLAVSSGCVSILFEKRTGRVWGVQLAGVGAASYSEYASMVVARRATLEEIVSQESAYPPRFNKDVPPIRLTAAKALAGR